MGCRIIHDPEDGNTVFYCSTMGIAFGPVMESRDEAELFLKILGPVDPRNLSQVDLMARFADFKREYVCECAEVRCTDCEYCADEIPLVGEMHEWTEQMAAAAHMPPKAFREPCNADRPPAEGERFQCRHCRETAARKAALKKGSHGN